MCNGQEEKTKRLVMFWEEVAGLYKSKERNTRTPETRAAAAKI